MCIHTVLTINLYELMFWYPNTGCLKLSCNSSPHPLRKKLVFTVQNVDEFILNLFVYFLCVKTPYHRQTWLKWSFRAVCFKMSCLGFWLWLTRWTDLETVLTCSLKRKARMAAASSARKMKRMSMKNWGKINKMWQLAYIKNKCNVYYILFYTLYDVID